MDHYQVLDRLNRALTFYGQLVSTANISAGNQSLINRHIESLLKSQEQILELIVLETERNIKGLKAELAGIIL